nr:uncharacterized protein LOC109168054 [Ipomoea trifida]
MKYQKDNTLKCTVWDDHVSAILPYYNANCAEPLIVVMQLCRAKVVSGEVRITSSYDATQLWFNQNFSEFVDFRSKLAANTSPLRSISTTTVLSQSTGPSEFQSGAVIVSTLFDLFEAEEVGVVIPPELEILSGMAMIFKIGFKKATMRGPNSAYNVVRVLRDQLLIDTYCSNLRDHQDKDLMSKMVEEDEYEESDSEEEASQDDEVQSPLPIDNGKRRMIDEEETDSVKKCLMDQFSTSKTTKKMKEVAVKQEKI